MTTTILPLILADMKDMAFLRAEIFLTSNFTLRNQQCKNQEMSKILQEKK